VPKGEYLYPACCGAILAAWTCWGIRKCNRQACERQFCSEVCWTSAGFGVSSQNTRRRIRHCLVNQHWAWCQELGNTQKQAQELILGPCPGAKARFLSFNRTQFRVIIDLLTGHNTLRRHLHLIGLSDIPLCRGCGAKFETSAHILCECEALPSHRHAYLGSSVLDPGEYKSGGHQEL